MRAVIQRVAEASVATGEGVVGSIGPGICVLLGIGKDDTENTASRLAAKIATLRIFEDGEGKMNRSITEQGGAVLVISQFTLYGDCRKGSRPSFSEAAGPGKADHLYQYFIARLRAAGLTVATGKFQARMKVALVNDGPVTLLLEA